MSKKFITIILVNILFLFSIVNSVVIQQTTNAVETKPGVFSQVGINWDMIIPIVIIVFLIGIVVMFVLWFVGKIVKKIRENRKQKEDLEFYKYSLDLKTCFMNKNSKYKSKNILTLGLLFKKAKIYARTSRGRRMVGYYEGELVKKEGFFILAIELRYTFFRREIDLVIFPYELIDQLIFFNEDGSIDLEVEGIDEVLSSELFSLPVFKNSSNKNSNEIFTDFSDRVYQDYFKKFGDRKSHIDTIKDSALRVKEATEMNVSVPYKRKTGNDLQE